MKLPIRIRASRFNDLSGLEDADGKSVCQFQPKGIDPRLSAAFIVRACNSHASLVAALEKVISALDDARDTMEGISKRRAYCGNDHYISAESNSEALEASSTEAGDGVSRADNELFDARSALQSAEEGQS